MNTQEFILNKFGLSFDDKTQMPIEIPNVGRNNLAEWLHELDFKAGVEVGVAEGSYSKVLCETNPQMKLFGVDPYRPLRGYRDYTRVGTFSRLENAASKSLGQSSNYKLIKKTSMEAVLDFEDGSLDFVYIDGDHSLQYVIDDIAKWSRKIKVGGIIAGHDYIRMRHKSRNHAKIAVEAHTSAWGVRPWFVCGTNEEVPGQIRDEVRSWFWVIQ